MTPLRFEAEQGPMWAQLAEQLALARQRKPVDAALLAANYRRVCENLALAQSRGYPVHLVARLEALAQEAHPLIYRRQDYGLRSLRRLLLQQLPAAVRAQRACVLWALALFALPLLLSFAGSLADLDFALRLHPAAQLREYEAMYGDGAGLKGRPRDAGDDWQMFGFYIFNNVGIGFRTFGAGVLGGVGSAFVMVYNGLAIGSVAGHLQRVGLGHNFWPFVSGHAAFELTGIVLSGAAGLRLGLGLLRPGRLARLEALRVAALAAVPLVYAAFFLLVLAAAVEAFWSPAPWVPPPVKYGVSALFWVLVLAWLGFMGRDGGRSGHAR